METFSIVMVIAIILFARLGVRLVFGWLNRGGNEDSQDD